MMTFLLIAVTTAMIQTAGAYLRYLPFRSGMSSEKRDHLWQLLLTWAVFSISLNTVLLSQAGLNVPLYKAVMFFGWLPYFLISLKVIDRPLTAHVFVLGMQCLWAIMLHTGAIMLETFMGLPQELEHLSRTHAIAYLSVFVLLLPVERSVFQNLLPFSRLFSTSFRWPMSLLPIIIFIGISLPIADSQLIHSWQHRVSRLTLPLTFFFVYRAMSIATNQAERDGRNLQESIWMRRQIATLKEYDLLQEDSNQQLTNLCRELHESYRCLDKYLATGDTEAALLHIEDQERRLTCAPQRLFADSPLINATLSIYVKRAEKLGITPTIKIHLPKSMATDEHDLAVLISNLLENAVEIEEKQSPGRRFLSVILETAGNQFVLKIINMSDQPLILGKNGLPCSNVPGHGIGMTSLTEFSEKYHAQARFSQENGIVQIAIRWADKSEASPLPT